MKRNTVEQPILKQPQQAPSKQDELILVVERTKLFAHEDAWHGLNTQASLDQYVTTINTHKEFLWRSQMEQDPRYKQIIPYLIFQHHDTFFMMQRKATASETRLQSKFSLGIGGHIRQEDIQENSLFSWAEREFHEEVSYTGTLTMEYLGILNDDSDAVGLVHIGFVLLLKGDSANIKINDEHKSGQLVTLDEAEIYYERMEGWSQKVFRALQQK